MCSVEVAGSFIEILTPEGQAFGRIHFHFPRLSGESDRALNARMMEYSLLALAAIRDLSRHAAGAKGSSTTSTEAEGS